MIWNSSLYDQQHDFVSKYGEDLVDLLAPKPGEHILDVGSGTGDLAALIARQGATVTGIDNSIEMIQTAQKKYPSLQFDLQSASDFHYNHHFDAVFSNATLHWVLAYEQAAQCICKALKPGGRFVAEMGGQGNVANIIKALQLALSKEGYASKANQSVWYFPSLSEYAGLLERNGFRVVYAVHFDRDTLLKTEDGIKNWLLQFGKAYLEDIEPTTVETIITAVENNIKPSNYKNGHWYADYVRLRMVAIKQ